MRNQGNVLYLFLMLLATCNITCRAADDLRIDVPDNTECCETESCESTSSLSQVEADICLICHEPLDRSAPAAGPFEPRIHLPCVVFNLINNHVRSPDDTSSLKSPVYVTYSARDICHALSNALNAESFQITSCPFIQEEILAFTDHLEKLYTEECEQLEHLKRKLGMFASQILTPVKSHQDVIPHYHRIWRVQAAIKKFTTTLPLTREDAIHLIDNCSSLALLKKVDQALHGEIVDGVCLQKGTVHYRRFEEVCFGESPQVTNRRLTICIPR